MLRALTILFMLVTSLSAKMEQALVPINKGGKKVTLSLFHFNNAHHKSSLSATTSDLGDLLRRKKQLAGVSVGMVSYYGKLTGYLAINGQKVQPITPSKGAKLTFISGSIKITEASKTSNSGNQLQAHPYLVQNKITNKKLSTKRHARRTFILTDKKGKFAIGYAPSITESELAYAISQYLKLKKKPYVTALQLTVGNHSGIWISRGKYHPYYLKTLKQPKAILSVTKR